MDIRKANVYGGRKVTRQMYTCEHGTFVKAPKGYYRLAPLVAIVTASIGLHVAIGAWFAFVSAGVTL